MLGPGRDGASAPSSGSVTSAGKTFNLAPEQDRIKVGVGSEAAALMPEAIKAERQTDREIAFTTQKGNGLAVAAQAALNRLIENGDSARSWTAWGSLRKLSRSPN